MKVKLTKIDNCIYLTQNLKDLNLYQRTKAIKNFIRNETKILEDLADTEIRTIFAKNGINIYSTDKSALNLAFDTLKTLGKAIDIVDIYENKDNFNCVLLGTSDNQISVWLEDDEILQCGIMIEERELK